MRALAPALGSSAQLSADRAYRYVLWRIWGRGPLAVFVGLNPSTADEREDDPTIRRCVRFARDWGFDGLAMVNLFAFRATDPRELRTSDDPIGPDNDVVLERVCADAGIVVAAWGANRMARDRAQDVVESEVLGGFSVLSLTASGHPLHPLYARASCVPREPLTLRPMRLPERPGPAQQTLADASCNPKTPHVRSLEGADG